MTISELIFHLQHFRDEYGPDIPVIIWIDPTEQHPPALEICHDAGDRPSLVLNS